MVPRKRLDIIWADWWFGVWSCFQSGDRDVATASLQHVWDENAASLTCLSVRSGFDALLTTLNWEPGSEILVSALTIGDIPRIVSSHGLVPVPLDIDPQSLSVTPDAIAAAVTPRTRAVLIAHLFGSRMAMEPLIAVARSHNLLMIEDCAQAYVGRAYRGHAQSSVRCFSFGPIKTATAFAGGMLQFSDAALCKAVQKTQTTWPVQNRWQFFARLLKYAVLMGLSYRLTYSLFTTVCAVCKIDHDRLISLSTRGFSGDNFFRKIRQQPSLPLLTLMTRRIQQFNPTRIARRIQLAEQLQSEARSLLIPGHSAISQTYWVFPILASHPRRLMRYLWQHGFDATQGASSLRVVAPPDDRPEQRAIAAIALFQQLLYLPIHMGMSSADVTRLATVLNAYADSSDFAGSDAESPSVMLQTAKAVNHK